VIGPSDASRFALSNNSHQANVEMLALISSLVWFYLFFAHGKFWKSGPELAPATPEEFPDVDIIVPARDEAETIRPVIASLLAQDYSGSFRVILVDDNSTDGTATIAGMAPKLNLICGQPKPLGWSGKLWALNQGIQVSSAPVLLFADADVIHDPRHLSSLVARLLHPRVELASELVRLNCSSPAERGLVPAFVYFFQMLYPFAKVNNPLSAVAAAAGGTILVRRTALDKIGGLNAMKNALIDDVKLAQLVKTVGPIYLGHSGLASSIRRYSKFSEIWRMISRTAFTQLHYSATFLSIAVIGLTVIFLVPAWEVIFGHGWRFTLGITSAGLAAISFMPTLARYKQNKLLALAMPLIALFYMAATVGSALNYWFGTGAIWKSRGYGPDNRT
jgi:hopene-associated glycosyltransferase HpnB